MTSSEEKTTLYLTDFPTSIKITEQDISQFLSSYSESILQIKEDKKKSLSFKVVFNDPITANKCRIEMNLKKYKNKSIRIMWDEHDSKIIYNTSNNLFFKGIPKNISPRKVYEYFLQFGDISSCKMTEDENGSHYGYGYVTFYEAEDAKTALDSTKEKQIELFENNFIEISFFQKKNERIIKSNDFNNSNKQKLYITNFPSNYQTKDLLSLCQQYGSVQSCNIFIDNYKKNFGIVQFSSEKEAKEILDKLDGKEIQGLKLNVKLYQQHKKINSGCNLYIRNIPLNAKENDLIKIFNKYGKDTSVRIEMYKKEDKMLSKGFGYLSFDNSESAEKAMDDLNGKYLPGFEAWSKTLLIEPFLSKQEREMNTLSYFNYSNQEINSNNNDNNSNKIIPQTTTVNFNNISININQYNTNMQYINNNQFNIFQQYQNTLFNYNQFLNYNYNNFHNNRNYYNNNNYKRNRRLNKKGNKDFDWASFNKLETEKEKREFLGEILYKKISDNEEIKNNEIDSDKIGKITGMIIALPYFNDVLQITLKKDLLNKRIKEALELIQNLKKDK